MQRNIKWQWLVRQRGVLILATAVLLSGPRPLLAQGDRGSITGSVLDPARSAVPSAAIVATSVERGETYEATSTNTGNYLIPSLPVGHYDLAVTAPGFTQYVQRGITIQVAQSARVDINLTVGSVSESLTVMADAALLKTEGADQSQTVSGDQINRLPLTIGGNGLYGTRSPLASLDLVPGVQNYVGTNFVFRANGSTNSPRYLVDGQDIDLLGMTSAHLSESHPSTEAIQEVTILTSNFAAEYGQVQGGLVTFTTRSGTNQFHGGGYDYLQNEHLNAGRPFTDDGDGHLVRPKQRNNNYGVTVGGPVWIPKLYNGRNKTFFFFTFDQFRQTQDVTGAALTVPTLAMRNGDFSKILTGKVLGTDPLGNPILENAIYDPTTTTTVNGNVVRSVFPNNIIPVSRLNPVAQRIQALIPVPDSGNLNNINNLTLKDSTFVLTSLPSFKIDHSIGSKTKVAFTFNTWLNTTSKSAGDGLPFPISNAREFITHTPQVHLNIDRTLSPSLLLHLGGGEVRYWHVDAAPLASRTYDAVGKLGLIGGLTDLNSSGTTGFPAITGIGAATVGGMPPNIGWSSATLPHVDDHPSFTSSLSWIKGNHNYKFGAEWWRDMDGSRSGATGGTWAFSAAETGLPYLNTTTLNGGAVGFGYASFLLGGADTASIRNVTQKYTSKHALGFYAQDTWKVSRKLTVDYGLRYDYQSAPHELHDRSESFSPTTPNPTAGGILGATVYEGYGPGHCNCSFSKVYPWAFGPRIGVAYQIDSKTVLRAGYGMVYGRSTTTSQNYSTYGVGFNTLTFSNSAFGVAAANFSDGLHYNESDLYSANLGAGVLPLAPGTVTQPITWWDDTGGRVPRINQWSISVQREIFKDLIVEAAYVGNRASHIVSPNAVQLNALSPQALAAKGYDPANPADLAVLTGTLAKALADPATVAKYHIALPYAAYPTSLSVAQSLRPYPQYTGITSLGSQRGYSWYDALQSKVTKRYSAGLTASASFTWQRELEYGVGVPNNVFNQAVNKQISSFSQPLVLAIGISYTTPAVTRNKLVRAAVKDWTIGSFLHYASGFPILAPIAQNNLQNVYFGNSAATIQSGTTSATSASGTFANRVAGQPLFIKDLNCHCIDPTKDFVLNPAAWSDPAPGNFGTAAAYYNDYRFQRHPGEQIGIGRLFPLHREGMSVEVRMEFFNIFNRAQMADPTFSNAKATQLRNAQGLSTSGFGYINALSPGNSSIIDNQTGLGGNPRQGQLLVRFKF